MGEKKIDQDAYTEELFAAAPEIIMGHQAGDGSDRRIIRRLEDRYGRVVHATLSVIFVHYIRLNCPPQLRGGDGVPSLPIMSCVGPLHTNAFLSVLEFDAGEERERELHQATLWAQRLIAEESLDHALNFANPNSWGSQIKDRSRLLELAAMCLCVCCIGVSESLAAEGQ
ncbi:hypothetical protein DN069_04410 [Streptacidiphilus pinicola]|uniref:Uncharacterized protein n=1 Tax=Streptacidiphilus pinicola TaxID=2219663 RepID=A0A2X0IQ65_9ACTN|nr:hypothetical protein [Streptacidiphilus pinicola]RAG86787.1 hypothetical protein DN069_04410 [Streptacidiphilus pinicola]